MVKETACYVRRDDNLRPNIHGFHFLCHGKSISGHISPEILSTPMQLPLLPEVFRQPPANDSRHVTLYDH